MDVKITIDGDEATVSVAKGREAYDPEDGRLYEEAEVSVKDLEKAIAAAKKAAK